MNKEQIISTLRNSELDLSRVWIICGGAMVLHELREDTSDIDLGCGTVYFEELLSRGIECTVLSDGMREIVYSESIEIFENWNIERSTTISGLNVSSIKDLIRDKEALNRPKDREDLKKLYKYQAEYSEP